MGLKIILVLLVVVAISSAQEISEDDEISSQQFLPTLTATCQLDRNRMVITLTTGFPFYGVVLSSSQRNNSHCFTEGTGQTQTTLSLNMLASINDEDYCGVSINHKNNEKTAQISVRQNRVLELVEDKNYLVSCSKFDSKPPTTNKPTHLALYDSENREALEVVNTHGYKLKIKTSKEFKHFRVRNCFAFSGGSTVQVALIDENGCPSSKIISRWTFADHSAEAHIYNMFRFQDSRSLTFQCHVLFCGNEETCPNPTCTEIPAYNFVSLTKPSFLISSPNDTDAIASTTVTVLEPGEKLAPLTLARDDDVCTGRFCPTWLLWLAIALGVLFLLMLLVNLFLCTALTCTCTRTELVEKDPSIIEDYDPYNARGGYFGVENGSHYNSRYSINQPVHSTKAYSDIMSDHYATPGTNNQIMSSRPNSRFSK